MKRPRIAKDFRDPVFDRMYGDTRDEFMRQKIAALETMRGEINDLKTQLRRREEEEAYFFTNIMAEYMRHRGEDLISHAKFLISLAGGEPA